MERLDDMLIIAPGPGDAADLAEVHVTAWRETYDGLLPADYLTGMDRQAYARRWRRQLMELDGDEIVLAAARRDRLVGYCAGRLGGRQREAEVSTLYLVREAQGLGAGRALLTAAARVFQARGAAALCLWVLDGNDNARAFYEHLGAIGGGTRRVRGWGGGLFESACRWPDIGRLTGDSIGG
jgi:ribosomal protein S18 acetylase RimI-like enzyme